MTFKKNKKTFFLLTLCALCLGNLSFPAKAQVTLSVQQAPECTNINFRTKNAKLYSNSNVNSTTIFSQLAGILSQNVSAFDTETLTNLVVDTGMLEGYLNNPNVESISYNGNSTPSWELKNWGTNILNSSLDSKHTLTLRQRNVTVTFTGTYLGLSYRVTANFANIYLVFEFTADTTSQDLMFTSSGMRDLFENPSWVTRDTPNLANASFPLLIIPFNEINSSSIKRANGSNVTTITQNLFNNTINSMKNWISLPLNDYLSASALSQLKNKATEFLSYAAMKTIKNDVPSSYTSTTTQPQLSSVARTNASTSRATVCKVPVTLSTSSP